MDEVGHASEELHPLIAALKQELTQTPKDAASVKSAMIDLLEYLVTPEGRTDANCTAVDHFLGPIDDWEPGKGLPEAFQEVLADMGSILHDAVSAPGIAENFESTPEQLLIRTRSL